ncbi:uncharacterized protein LOC128393267 [Panonychus citri]|uniref:uncharacterized protein LOC128393267 n=1 Tax=Panonychus citri TaxID=50023 RepID=UPI00230705E4|nr:uncharacterized protein LOC128393267 [Panonychus citri]
MSSNVRITQTTTTTTTASVLVINTGYLKTKLGLLKSLIFILTLIAFILMSVRHRYLIANNDFLFLYLINWCHLYAIFLMLITCLFSLSTATLMPKMTFDFVFHFSATILFLLAGLWSISIAIDSYYSTYKTASILAFLIALLHALHGYFSYATCKLH